MKKSIVCLTVCLLVMSSFQWICANDYYENTQPIKSSDVESRFEIAKETLRINQDESAMVESIKDLVRFSLSLGKNEEALSIVESVIPLHKAESEMYGRLQLAKGRIMMRLGRIDEAMTLLKEGVQKHWKENAFWEINSALMETGQRARLAVDEYDRNMGDEYSKETRKSYGIGSDLSIFFIRLLEMKQARPDLDAMDAVFPQITVSSWRNYAYSSAKALCQAADQLFEEAKMTLAEIDAAMDENSEILRDCEELKFYSLHKALILFYEAKDTDAARRALQDYMNHFPDDPGFALNRALDFIYCLDNNGEDCKKVAEITGFFLNHTILKDEKIRDSLPRHKVASVYDTHARSLAWRGQFEESADYTLYVMNEYPNTLAGYNCAMNYARHIGWSRKNIDEAEMIYRGLLEENKHEALMPWVQFCLAELLLGKGDIENALALVEEVLKQEFAPEQETGTRLRKVSLELKEKIEKIINDLG